MANSAVGMAIGFLGLIILLEVVSVMTTVGIVLVVFGVNSVGKK